MQELVIGGNYTYLIQSLVHNNSGSALDVRTLLHSAIKSGDTGLLYVLGGVLRGRHQDYFNVSQLYLAFFGGVASLVDL
jgi:hypothetical protein